MSTIGVNSTADERWDAGQPECGEDFCDACGECLGCSSEGPCYGFEDDEAVRHIWVNSDEEVKLV